MTKQLIKKIVVSLVFYHDPDLTKKIESLILNPPEENPTIETNIMEASG